MDKMIISPAQRLNTVSEYYFSKKLKEIAGMNAEGKHVLNLGIGNPDNPPSSATIAKLVETAQKPNSHGYQSYNGTPQLRSAFADWYKTYFGVELNPANEILPLIGSKEGSCKSRWLSLIREMVCWFPIGAIQRIARCQILWKQTLLNMI